MRDSGENSAQGLRAAAAAPATFLALQHAVRAACDSADCWQAGLSAAIHATLDFAAERPAAMRALAVLARPRSIDGGPLHSEVVSYFASLLTAGAPPRHPVTDSAERTIEAIATLLRGRLLVEDTDRLPILAPELIYLALLPCTGATEAQRWAEAPTQVQL